MKEELLYKKAKDSYWFGNPIMSQKDFYDLEKKLIKEQSIMVNSINFPTKRSYHKFPILKNIDQIDFTVYDEHTFSMIPMFNAPIVNLVYRNGNLTKIVTYGNGVYGKEYDSIDDFKNIIPLTIPFKDEIDIRGYLTVKESIFNEKYQEFENTKFFVECALGADYFIDTRMAKDFEFFAFEMRSVNESLLWDEIFLPTLKFQKIKHLFFNTDEFETTIEKFRSDKIDYDVLGEVIRFNPNVRSVIGDNGIVNYWSVNNYIEKPNTDKLYFDDNLNIDLLFIDRLYSTLNVLKFEYDYSFSQVYDMYYNGITNIVEFFEKVYTDGLEDININEIIYFLYFKGVDMKTTFELGNYFSSIPYDFSELDKNVVTRFLFPNSIERTTLSKFIAILNEKNVKIIYNKEKEKEVFVFEMEGKPTGFANKKEFMKFAKQYDLKHGGLNSNCQFLITDNLKINSNKKRIAASLNIPIVTYDQFKELIVNQN